MATDASGIPESTTSWAALALTTGRVGVPTTNTGVLVAVGILMVSSTTRVSCGAVIARIATDRLVQSTLCKRLASTGSTTVPVRSSFVPFCLLLLVVAACGALGPRSGTYATSISGGARGSRAQSTAMNIRIVTSWRVGIATGVGADVGWVSVPS